ncbi:hypothetical protein GT347_05740 [Xylophilus rhododendri]|uniref:Uncharacterized protein n=1 Tax=Xylophilus rhododendri TaxID=2697032 RepID=A0A857J2R6_9BURK|nr:hypothetical protein [Xylophilus rhododendri]QHI97533.1 hypothetical protein GT347_05740 [Xylophilus rhododendri]
MTQDTTGAQKDAFFAQLGQLSDAMTAAFGKDFAIGALVLAARYLAERTAPDTQETAPAP